MQNKEQNQVAGAILIVGILIAGAILLKGSNTPTNSVSDSNNSRNLPSQATPVNEKDHITGNKDAKVVIVEYSDLECPFCKIFHSTMSRVITDNDVAWVYRHYPIPQLHSKAQKEAEATECAWEQGGNDAFWKYTNRIFEITPSNNGLEESKLVEIAQYAGLDIPSFSVCLESGKYQDKVQADVDSGNNSGVTGTPSSFIFKDGKVVDTIRGAQPYEVIKEKLDRLK